MSRPEMLLDAALAGLGIVNLARWYWTSTLSRHARPVLAGVLAAPGAAVAPLRPRRICRRGCASGSIFCWNISAIGQPAIDDCSACARSSVFLFYIKRIRQYLYIVH
ncbi:hypothetical protein M8494_25720 [Serratia ureilytica]